MAGVVPNDGEKNILKALIGNNMGAFKIRLFKNDITPGDNTILGDFQEADFDSYSPGDGTDWGAPATQGNGKAATTHGVVVFTKGAGANMNTIYGYYLTYSPDGMEQWLIAAEKFGSPIAMNNEGDSFQLTVTFTMAEDTPA